MTRSKEIVLALAVLAASCTAPSQIAPQIAGDQGGPRAGGEAAAVASIVDPIIAREMAESGAPGAAFAFVRHGRIVYSRGYGLSDLAAGARVDPARTVWPVASITKTVTALGVLQLAEEGRVDLDADINQYLRRLQVAEQDHGPLTLRHLLTHTHGLDELPGRQTDGAALPDMATFLAEHLVRYRAPGVRTAYGTYGIMLAALVIEEVSGQSYADYVREHIFSPTNMGSARFMLRRGDEAGVATPYDLEDANAAARSHEWYVSTAASSMVATADDMARLLLVHTGEGSLAGRRVLTRTSMRLMHDQQASVHAEVPGWAMGMQMDVVNGRRIAEHGGDIGGFSSLFVVLPDEDAGFFIVSHGEGTNLRYRVREALLDGIFPSARAIRPPTPAPLSGEVLREYAGRYMSSLACHTCGQADAEIFTVEAQSDGSLSLWGQRWIPAGGDLFVRDDGKRRLGFARDSDGAIAAVSGGSWRVADRLN